MAKPIQEKEKKEQNKINSADCQILIGRFDVRIATHIAGIVAIVFGAFTVLPFLEGKSYLFSDVLPFLKGNYHLFLYFNLPFLYVFLLEIIGFPLGIAYCLSRSTFYSRAAEAVKAKSDISLEETEAYNEALETMPWAMKKILKFRLRIHRRFFYVFLLAYAFWILLILAVLFI